MGDTREVGCVFLNFKDGLYTAALRGPRGEYVAEAFDKCGEGFCYADEAVNATFLEAGRHFLDQYLTKENE